MFRRLIQQRLINRRQLATSKFRKSAIGISRGFLWSAVLTSTLAVLTFGAIISQTWVMHRQQVLMTQQSTVAASDRLERLAAKQLDSRLLVHRLKGLLNPFHIAVLSRSCGSEKQCNADMVKTICTMKLAPRKPDVLYLVAKSATRHWTAAQLIEETFATHDAASRILFGPVFEAPHAKPVEQAEAVVEGMISPAIIKCGFSHPAGKELTVAMDTLATLAEANAF